MRAMLAVAALAAIATTPPAHAAPLVVGTSCGLVAVHHNVITGQNFEGVLVGAVAAVEGGPAPVTMTCTVKVNGMAVPAATATSVIDNGVAVVLSQAVFEALPGDFVEVCTDIDSPGSPGYSGCVRTTESVVPPQEVCDLIAIVMENVPPNILTPLCTLVGPTTVRLAVPQPVIR